MKFIKVPSTNTDQRTKLIDYFERLHQAKPVIEQFADGTFRVFATFLYSSADKVGKRWVIKVYIIEDLYDYAYPFIFKHGSSRIYQTLIRSLIKHYYEGKEFKEI